jgi:hypothetical protein
MKRLALLAVVVAAVWSSSPALAADGFYVIAGRPAVGTRITYLPYTITAPGYYYLTRNLSCAGGDGITVDADNVTIDLMGFVLAGPGITNTGINIYNHNNVEIRNGTVKGWYSGISESGASNNIRVIDIRAKDNNFDDISLSLGDHNLIQNCTVQGSPTGLYFSGRGCALRGCIAIGAQVGANGGTASDNLVLNSGYTSGLFAAGTVSHNVVINCPVGISNSLGGSLIGNVVFANSGQTGIEPGEDPAWAYLLDQNTVGGAGTHYGPGNSATVWGVNAGK